MPITLSLTGHAALSPARLTRAEARDWLASAAVWFEGLGDSVLDARVVRDTEEKPVLLVVMHPASPPVEIRLGASGRVRVYAPTSPAGPGYHIHLCERFRQLATDFDLTWDDAATSDPTGYFTTDDRAECEKQFLLSLGRVCGAAATHPGDGPIYVGLSPAHGFTAPGPVLTPLGPRPREWLAATAAELGAQAGMPVPPEKVGGTGIPACARQFYPWWNPDPDAAFYRNRALTRLWCDFPWRPPLTEDEGEMTDQIANDLATAYKLDPAGELPWREWLEVLAAIEADEEVYTVNPTDPALTEAVTQRAWEADPAEPLIGYRRHPVRVPLCGGWSIEVPGDFARGWDDERTWTGWNNARTVWFHPVSFTKPDGSRPTPAEAVAVGRRSLPDGEPVPWADPASPQREQGSAAEDVNPPRQRRPVAGEVSPPRQRGPTGQHGLTGTAVYGEAEEDGRRVWRLSGVSAAEGQLVVCHVYTEDPSDRDWAIRTWHSLRHAG